MDRASLVAQMVKNLPAMQEIWVQSLGWEDSLEKEITIHSGILVWRIPWTEKPGGLQSMGSQRVRHDWAINITQVMDIEKLYFLQCFHKSKIISKEKDNQQQQHIYLLLLFLNHSVVSDSVDFATLWAVAHQAPLSMGFSREAYQNGLPCSHPGDLLNSGFEPGSPALQEDSLPLSHQGSPTYTHTHTHTHTYI